MAKLINLKKGLDINISGAAADPDKPLVAKAARCAIIPDDYPGITPKVDVKEGDLVKVGTTIFHDKNFPDIRIVAPIDGTVTAVARGERRKLLRVEIQPDPTAKPIAEHQKGIPADPVKAQQLLLDTGLWALIRQRPYGIVPRPGTRPRDIMVTTFDSAPLAPSFDLMAKASLPQIKAAVALLKMLTDGNVYLGVRPDNPLSSGIDGATTFIFNGPHPAGNPGVQIANIKPVNKGDVVWTLDLPTLVRIGKAVTDGTIDFATQVALTGSEVNSPHYINTVVGADLSSLLDGQVKHDGINHRTISGNVLTGSPENPDNGFLRYPYYQITVIAEGDDRDEFMGWASLSPAKMSISRSFPGHFLKKAFSPDARILGGRRAMIMSGIYDKLLPMDVMVEYLIKACIAKDLDRMEQLGLYELVPEDIALCEYADPSKIELQRILRDGLDYAFRELS